MAACFYGNTKFGGRVDSVMLQIVGMGVAVGMAVAGCFFALLRWSVLRNISEIDERLRAMAVSLEENGARFDEMQLRFVLMSDFREFRICADDRQAASRAEMLEWMRRQDDKIDRLLLLVAEGKR